MEVDRATRPCIRAHGPRPSRRARSATPRLVGGGCQSISVCSLVRVAPYCHVSIGVREAPENRLTVPCGVRATGNHSWLRAFSRPSSSLCLPRTASVPRQPSQVISDPLERPIRVCYGAPPDLVINENPPRISPVASGVGNTVESVQPIRHFCLRVGEPVLAHVG